MNDKMEIVTVPQTGTQLANAAYQLWSPEHVRLIREMYANDATEQEFDLFLAFSKARGLDPFMKQVHFTKRRQKQGDQWVNKAVYIVGIDGYRLIADRTGTYAPGRTTEYTYKADGTLESATAYVKKYHAPSNTWNEYSATAYLDEYLPRNSRGEITNPQWQKMPHVLLAKCAEAAALRRGFPAELGGMYIPEEMDQAADITIVQPDESARDTWQRQQERPPAHVIEDAKVTVEDDQPPSEQFNGSARRVQTKQKYQWIVPKLSEASPFVFDPKTAFPTMPGREQGIALFSDVRSWLVAYKEKEVPEAERQPCTLHEGADLADLFIDTAKQFMSETDQPAEMMRQFFAVLTLDVVRFEKTHPIWIIPSGLLDRIVKHVAQAEGAQFIDALKFLYSCWRGLQYNAYDALPPERNIGGWAKLYLEAHGKDQGLSSVAQVFKQFDKAVRYALDTHPELRVEEWASDQHTNRQQRFEHMTDEIATNLLLDYAAAQSK